MGNQESFNKLKHSKSLKVGKININENELHNANNKALRRNSENKNNNFEDYFDQDINNSYKKFLSNFKSPSKIKGKYTSRNNTSKSLNKTMIFNSNELFSNIKNSENSLILSDKKNIHNVQSNTTTFIQNTSLTSERLMIGEKSKSIIESSEFDINVDYNLSFSKKDSYEHICKLNESLNNTPVKSFADLNFKLDKYSTGLSSLNLTDSKIENVFDANLEESFRKNTQNLNVDKEKNKLCREKYKNMYSFKKKDSFTLMNEYLITLAEKKMLFVNNQLKFNNLFIIDWDDTLLPTSYLIKSMKSSGNITEEERLILFKIEFNVLRILNYAVENKCDVYLMSGADRDWIKISSRKFLKGVYKMIKGCSNIRLIYFKDYKSSNDKDKIDESLLDSSIYEKDFISMTTKNSIFTKSIIKNQDYDSNIDDLKEKALNSIFSNYDKKFVTNIVAFSHSIKTINLLTNKTKDYKESYLKVLKLMDYPNVHQVNKQLTLLADQINTLYTSVKNVNVKVKISK